MNKTFYFKAWLLLACLVVLICNVSCSSDDNSSEVSVTSEILRLVNEHRASIGKQELVLNTLATKLADEHTFFMIDQQKIGHENFDQRADRLFDEENAKGIGENVAAKQKSAQDVMAAWLDSKGHRENIEGDFTHIGISAIKNKDGHYYYTQLFLKK
ncbi:CAP domain-containing protein [Flavivirga sp. 57AJ16]|uniref:CAP domain-containing protein n=1 Tax=Flavivirga sp. 57AJ16 TaxID=3025307 RepID=UPI002366E806|nr:CAP domain-containing protein [Flavivirga sp. 57AJ16]MDD7884788.1 CAP domain-containing protein [Flavivirga sp. 57AJ16]